MGGGADHPFHCLRYTWFGEHLLLQKTTERVWAVITRLPRRHHIFHLILLCYLRLCCCSHCLPYIPTTSPSCWCCCSLSVLFYLLSSLSHLNTPTLLIPLPPSTCRKHLLLFFILPPGNERSGDMGKDDSMHGKNVWVTQQPPLKWGDPPMFHLVGVCFFIYVMSSFDPIRLRGWYWPTVNKFSE